MSEEPVSVIGIIAGGGRFPIMAAAAAREKGLKVVAVAHLGETEPALESAADEIVWVKLGQLGQVIKALKRHGVRQALMAGTITKRRMFEGIRPDLRGLALASKLALFHDDDILRAVSREFAKDGIEIVPSTTFLPGLVAPGGCLTRRKLSRGELEDVRCGWRIAKELGRLDIGQCVVVREKAVLAVEAIDGTDATIRRGGAIAGEKAVVVKVSKPTQDLRFDMPTVGLQTVELMVEVRAAVLAVEAGKTLMFDREAMIAKAEKAGIKIVSFEAGEMDQA